jgi:hypothetical protein
MTEPDEKKTKPVVQTREPKKKVAGIFDNLRKIPEPHPVEEILGLTNPTPSTPSSSSTLSTGSIGSTARRPSTPSRNLVGQTVAPERDYTRVANSIVRHAVPSGLFGEQGGKAKELYDTLYSLTRGAVSPKRKVRIPKDQLMRKAGIGSEVTLRKNLMRLRDAKLVKEGIVPGTHGGNEYEVFLPEEVGLMLPTPSTPSRPSTPSTGSNPPQIREGVEPLESTASSPSLSLDISMVSADDKTLFLRHQRTDDDDAALAGVIAALKSANKEITGRELSRTEADRWKELADVLVAELKIAAARTTVSSVPAFLAEHLRRRLWKVDKKQARAEGRELPDETIGSTLLQENSKDCPDCGGSGWWYPEGTEKGVAKCKHARLKQAAEEGE